MPNWCDQDLYITGPKKERDRFIEAARVRDEDDTIDVEYGILTGLFPSPKELISIHSGFNTVDGVEVNEWREIDGKIIPLTAEEQLDLMKKYGALNWYDWQIQNWGTKWGDCETVLTEHGDRRTTFSFETAWSPMTAGLMKISELFPKLKFKLNFFESGMGFRGTDVIKNGEQIDGKYYDNYRGGRGG
jgi:hypothetical protein